MGSPTIEFSGINSNQGNRAESFNSNSTIEYNPETPSQDSWKRKPGLKKKKKRDLNNSY